MNLQHLATVVVAAAAVATLSPATAQACSCLQPSLTRAWHDVSDTVEVDVIGERVSGGYRYYEAQVVRPFSGCTVAGDHIWLETDESSAACGTTLTVGQRWLVTASNDDTRLRADTFQITACGYNLPWRDVTAADRAFLADRPVTCPSTGMTTCADGSAPVSCLADPCDVADDCDTAEICESNTCGGCTAEFYDAMYEAECRPW